LVWAFAELSQKICCLFIPRIGGKSFKQNRYKKTQKKFNRETTAKFTKNKLLFVVFVRDQSFSMFFAVVVV